MKRKTSITLSDDLLDEIDIVAGVGGSRSAYIERVLRTHFMRLARATQEASDLERINAAADRLNAEMAEVLELQAPWSEGE
jgi:metal-responsive CopG/Arc/MetJ family transcriptional regulator